MVPGEKAESAGWGKCGGSAWAFSSDASISQRNRKLMRMRMGRVVWVT